MQSSIVAKAKYTIPCPTPPTAPINANAPMAAEQLDQWLYDKRLDALIKCESILNSNIQSLYSLVLGQCMDLIQTKLKQQNTWATIHDEQDGIALLVLIKMVAHHFEDQSFYLWHSTMPR